MLTLPTLLAACSLAAPWAVARAEPAGAPTELWVQLTSRDQHLLARQLGLGFVEGQEGDWWRLDGPPGIEADLDAVGLAWRPASQATASDVEGYHDTEQVIERLDRLVAEQPELVQRVDLGWSVEGRPIVGVRLSTTDTPRLQWRLVGTHHGDEWSSSEVALDAAVRLVAAWQDDPELARLLDTDAVWVVPQLNPDGFEAASRYNSNTVDLNRNYDYLWSDREWLPGDSPFSEPETRSLRALHSWVPAAAGLSFHAGAANIGWVWNYTTNPTDDDAQLRALADLYGDACTTPAFWRTNGADWYVTNGDTNDWAYGRLGVFDFTVEVSVTKMPPAATLPDLRDDHWPGVRAFLLGAESAAGQVVDAATGLGVPATLTPIDGGQPQLTGPEGYFARIIDGPRLVRVEAAGFASTERTLVPGDDTAISLVADDLVSTRPWPMRLPAGSTTVFTLPLDSDRVTLRRPGHEAATATATSGGWQIDTTGLAAGPWDLQVDDGIAPRAIFVREPDQAVVVRDHDWTGEGLRLVGEGFGQGTAAWILVGDARSPVSVPVLRQEADELLLDLTAVSGLGSSTDVLDLALLSNGRQVAVLDITDQLDDGDDTGADSGADSGADGGADGGADSGASTDAGLDGTVQPVGCGCGAAPLSPLPFLFSLPLLPFLRRRSHP